MKLLYFILNVCLTLYKIAKVFCLNWLSYWIFTGNGWEFWVLRIPTNTGIVIFVSLSFFWLLFVLVMQIDMQWKVACGLRRISSMTKDTGQFWCVYFHSYMFFIPIPLFCPLLIGLFSCYWVLRILYICWFKCFIKYVSCKHYLPGCGLSFQFS